MIVSDRRDEEIEEITNILDSYDVFGHDIECICNKFDSVYDELEKAYKVGRQLEAFVQDELGRDGYNKFLRIIARQEYPGEHLKHEC